VHHTFILIGGRSSRFGSDKAFAQLGGNTLFGRIVETARNAFPAGRITAVAANEAQFAIEAVSSGVAFIFDLHEGRGPLGGFQAALAHASTPWILMIACDYPFVTPELLRLLADRISIDHYAVVPEQNDGRLQPLCAFYEVEPARSIVEGLLERPRVSPPIHEVAMLLDPTVIRFDEYSHLPGASDFFTNINTVEDLERARDGSQLAINSHES